MDRFLPVKRDRGASYKWPETVKFSLLALSKGPASSQVASGDALHDCILDMQRELHSEHHMARDAADGLSLFFDDLMPRPDAHTFFHQTLPNIANLALYLPNHLENQSGGHVMRLLCKQERGMVVLTQRLISSLLACSFLCLYPSVERRRESLPHMNLDRMFAGVYERGESIMHKMLCLLHYFERVCESVPEGVVSFERKVVPAVSLREANAFWSASSAALCRVEVVEEGSIEDLGQECLQVDFANKMLGGGALGDGCVQEEIRFMINPELAAGMVFLPAMAANESIEIVGAERYSTYTGYASTFRFTGDYRDSAPRDAWGRRQTHVIAIDALSRPGDDQFRLTHIMRELSKAYCGFLDSKPTAPKASVVAQDSNPTGSKASVVVQDSKPTASDASVVVEDREPTGFQPSVVEEPVVEEDSQFEGFYPDPEAPRIVDGDSVGVDEGSGASDQIQGGDGVSTGGGGLGIATGNWGCGVFGGNLALKSMLQWLAASQAGRPYVMYFSFQNPDAQRLQEVADWILQEGWVVGELWSLVSEYAQTKQLSVNLFDWILPLPGTDLDRPVHHAARSNHPAVVPYFALSRGSNRTRQ